MTIVVVEGFDSYNGVTAAGGLNAGWPLSVSTGISMVTGRFGGQAVSVGAGSGASGTGTRPTKKITATSTVSMGMAVQRLSNSPGYAADINFYASDFTTLQMCFYFNATGGIQVSRDVAGAGHTLGTTANNVLPLNTWVYLEIEMVMSNTVGVVNMYVDGVSVMALTGQNTSVSTTLVNVGMVMFGTTQSIGTTGTGSQTYWDDMYLNNTGTRTGICRVETLRPNADTAQKDWTPDTGTADFSRVNETLCDGDTSYVQASTVGNLDLYDFGSLTGTPASIKAVAHGSFAERTDINTRSIALAVKSNTTSSQGPDFSLTSSYQKFSRVLEQDPDTSAAWTTAGVNALLAGPKVTV